MMQSQATDKASQIAQKQYEQTRGDLAPYRQAGEGATNMLMQQLPDLTKPIIMDQATLQKTPGYQFALNQGLKATQNSAAARGLGQSGAALRGAADYAKGLAQGTYLDQFNVANTNNTNTYNRLMQGAQLGQNAAAQTGTFGTQTAQQIGANTIGGANAMAGGLIGAGNAAQGGLNNYLGYDLSNKLLQSGLYGKR